ncbi:MAG: hypothetical protein J1F66_00580 [Clostridiales bacterium]|nr:hypothetical protein [Clostridiales bacterium]
MVNNSRAFQVARYAVMLATILVAVLMDKTITLGWPIAGATVELLVTMTFCFLFNSWLDGFLSTAFMGLSSFIWSFPFANVASQNPVISIVPRLFVGIIAYTVYWLMLLILGKVKNQTVKQTASIVVATFVGLIANTILYLSALSLFGDNYGSLTALLQGVAIANILPEYLVSLFGVSAVVLGVRHGLKLGLDGNNWKRAQKEEIIEKTEEKL